MLARLSAFVIWALVASTAVFWGLRLFVQAPAAPSYAVAVADTATVRSDLGRLLGSPKFAVASLPSAPEASSRFRLLGIVAPKYPAGTSSSGRGVALIAVDGKMAKAYSVGSRLDGDLVLQSVSLRTASIAPAEGVPLFTLELPAPPPPATGTLSIGGSTPGPVVSVPSTPMPVPQYGASPSPVAPALPPSALTLPQPVPPPNAGVPGASTQ